VEALGALEGAGRALRAGLGTAGSERVDLYGRDAQLSEALAPLMEFLYTRWFRVQVEGAEQIPAGGALLVANHAGALPLDGPILQEALRRERPELPEARWLAEDAVFYAPLLGTLFNRLGRCGPRRTVPLGPRRGSTGASSPRASRASGPPAALRPPAAGRGFVKLALRTARPVLPVAIVGGEEALPLLGKLPGGFFGVPYLPVTPLGPFPLPAKWRIRIGAPLAVPPGATEKDLPLVESLVDATRSTIAQMLRELLGARESVFLG
jgi:1-acyl-sn-glycerol-3-phosphate acyltransferase